MKRHILAISLCASLSSAPEAECQYTEMYCNYSLGTNTHSGHKTNQIPDYFAANGGWNSGTGVFTPASGNPSSSVAVGDWASVYADGSTVTPFVGRVTAVNATTITVSTSAKSGTPPGTSASGISCTVGGVWKGPNAADPTPWNFASPAMTNASGHPLRVNFLNQSQYEINAPLTQSTSGPVRWEGCTSAAGDGGIATLYGHTNGSFTLYTPFNITGAGNQWVNLWFTGGGTGPVTTPTNQMVNMTGQASFFKRCRFTGSWRATLTQSGGGSVYEECEFHNSNKDDANQFSGVIILEESSFRRCFFHTSTNGTDSSGILIKSDSTEPVIIEDSIIADNTSHGIEITGSHISLVVKNCDIVNSGESGVHMGSLTRDGNSRVHFENVNFINSAEWGIFHDEVGLGYPHLVNCGFFGNLNNHTNLNASLITGSITYSSSPYVDLDNGDFRLNSTANAGALARNAGRGSFLQDANVYSGTTISYPDVGAAQTTNSATGGDTIYISVPIFRR